MKEELCILHLYCKLIVKNFDKPFSNKPCQYNSCIIVKNATANFFYCLGMVVTYLI